MTKKHVLCSRTIILGVVLFVIEYDKSVQCVMLLWGLVVGYLVILILSMAVEVCICAVAMRGSILDTGPRASMQYILYLRLSKYNQKVLGIPV